MCLASNLEKPKENQCFCFPRASGDPGGTIGPTTPVILAPGVGNPGSVPRRMFGCAVAQQVAWLASDLRCGEFATSCAW